MKDGQIEESPSIHLDAYFQCVLQAEGEKGKKHVASMRKVCNQFITEKVQTFAFSDSSKVLLLGEVQSGKTAQILALVSALADESDMFRTFVLLTTSNIALHDQTLVRCMENLTTFVVCGERDELRLRANANRLPVLIVLKKNATVLKRWRNILVNSRLLQGRPLTLIDDEADATSLNTAINRGEQSTINRLLEEVSETASSSLFLQVTATPQALLLQTGNSGWKPTDSIYFPPGDGYLGGAFFFSDPRPFSYRQTRSGELSKLRRAKSNISEIPEGFLRSLANYLVASNHLLLSGYDKTTFLIHPSWTKLDHSVIRNHLNIALDYFRKNQALPEVTNLFNDEWVDLQKSFPALLPLKTLVEQIKISDVNIHVLNSAPDNSVKIEFRPGSNVVVGGNSLGRGLTFPMLLTTYYCRESKIPQQDTIWQHCRMFGYDRIPGLSRMFMPGDLYDLFAETHAANEVLIKMIRDREVSELQILTGVRARPTRRNVVDQSLFEQYIGGHNYFPNVPDISAWSASNLDVVLDSISKVDGNFNVTLELLIKTFQAFASDHTGEWSTKGFVTALEMYKRHKNSQDRALVILRRNRNISLGTGTLLSPNDRSLTQSVRDRPVFVAYRLNGKIDGQGTSEPFWIPNIKLPNGYIFNFLNE